MTEIELDKRALYRYIKFEQCIKFGWSGNIEYFSVTKTRVDHDLNCVWVDCQFYENGQSRTKSVELWLDKFIRWNRDMILNEIGI